MDPVNIKFVQLILAEVFGIALSGIGIWLFLRGATGRMTLFVQGFGMKARLTNATLGGVVFLLGCMVVIVAVTMPSVERHERTSEDDSKVILEQWLSRSHNVSEVDNYGEVTGTIWGTDAVRRARVEIFKISEGSTLGRVTIDKYGEDRLWPLLAAINKDRSYFKLSEASADTPIPANAYLEVWYPSRFYGTTTETWVRVSGPVKKSAYNEILGIIQSGLKWDEDITFSDLDKRFRNDELGLAYSLALRNGAKNLRDLSLKYYGSTHYWPIIAWVNNDVFDSGVSDSTALPSDDLYVVHFVP